MPGQATETYQWMHETCRRFSEATGWPLEFVPADGHQAGRGEELSAEDVEPWSVELRDELRAHGTLRLGLPSRADRDRDFATVRELAELIGRLFNRLLESESGWQSRQGDIAELIGAGTAGDESDVSGILNGLLRAAVKISRFRTAAFFLINSKTSRLQLRGVQGAEACQIPFRSRSTARSLADLKALVHGTALIRRTQGGDLWLPDDAATGLCLAVRSEEGPLGTLWLYDRRSRMPGDYERTLLRTLAGQIASRLERIVLLHEKASGERMQRDLQVAGLNQRRPSWVRDGLPGNLDSAAVCTSRYELGGDLCELFPLDDRRVVVAVGDASGDSVPAALVMSAARGALRATACEPAVPPAEDTKAVIERINHTLCAITPPHQFMSLFYGVLDTHTGRFLYTNAGHPAPVLVRREPPRPLDSHGLLLGVSTDALYAASSEQLLPGDLLVLFTDGVSEARDARREMFGTSGVIEAATPMAAGSAEDVMTRILNRLDRHTGTSQSADDRTLMVLLIGQPRRSNL